jgi:hypothetical protein
MNKTLTDLWFNLKHRVCCKRDDAHFEHASSELYLRCSTCGLRSPGVSIGPFKAGRVLAGDPERFRQYGGGQPKLVQDFAFCDYGAPHEDWPALPTGPSTVH